MTHGMLCVYKPVTKSSYRNNSTITELVIGENVTTIGKWCFSNCENLREIIFSDKSSLKEIEACAFYQCNSLEHVVLPDGLVEIGDSAFSCCKRLKTVTIPNSLEIWGLHVFGGCDDVSLVIDDNQNAFHYAFAYEIPVIEVKHHGCS